MPPWHLFIPGVSYAAQVGTSHSNQPNTFFSGLPVSGIVTPIEPSNVLYFATFALAASNPASPAGAGVVSAPAPVVADGAVVASVLSLSLPQAVATMAPHASTTSSDLNLVIFPPQLIARPPV